MTPEDRYHFEPLLMSVESAIGRGESVGQYHHSEVLRLLRAALAAAEAAPLDAPSGGSPYVTRLTNSLSYHVAAEAAPLDVERLARAWSKAFAPIEPNDGRITLLAREYAALRSPDTETCPDCGLSAERIGQMHITAQRLRSPDTETAGEPS